MAEGKQEGTSVDEARKQVEAQMAESETPTKPISRPVTRRLVVRRMNPEVSFADDDYTVEQSINVLPEILKNQYKWKELRGLYDQGIQISVRS